MQADDIYKLIDEFVEMKKLINEIQDELSNKSIAINKLNQLKERLQKYQEKVILEATINAIRGTVI